MTVSRSSRYTSAGLFLLQLAKPLAAFEVTHAAVIIARTGEHVPFHENANPALTPLGADQMESAGRFFRSRYITSETTSSNSFNARPISGISVDGLDHTQMSVLTSDDQYMAGSAAAFLQGFYPPFTDSSSVSASLANGSAVQAPLGGYQYPRISSVGLDAPQSVYVGINSACPQWAKVTATYQTSKEFVDTEASSKSLYESLGNETFQGYIDVENLAYQNALLISEYIEYLNLHDSSVNETISNSPDLIERYIEMQALADKWAWSLNSGTDSWSQNSILPIAGRMVAGWIWEMLSVNQGTYGALNKFNLLVTDFEPFLAFMALNSINEYDSDVQKIPYWASSMTIELFSISAEASNASTEIPYPAEEDLWVRFSYHDNTVSYDELDNESSDAQIRSFSLFGLGPSNDPIKYIDFVSQIQDYAITSTGQWCAQCQATITGSPFCAAYRGANNVYYSDIGWNRGISPNVAGLIGAIVALLVAALVLVLIALFCGVRLRRVERLHLRPSKNTSPVAGVYGSSGGYKGDGKLASDADLHLPKNAAPVGITVVPAAADPSHQHKGHERVGSWEMKCQTPPYSFVEDKALEAGQSPPHSPAGPLDPPSPTFSHPAPTLDESIHSARQDSKGLAAPPAQDEGHRPPSWVIEEDVVVNPYATPVAPHERV